MWGLPSLPGLLLPSWCMRQWFDFHQCSMSPKMAHECTEVSQYLKCWGEMPKEENSTTHRRITETEKHITISYCKWKCELRDMNIECMYTKIICRMNANISHALPSMRYIMKFAKIGLRAEGNSRGVLLTTIFWDRTHVATAVTYHHPTIIISGERRHWNMHLQQNVTIIKHRLRAKWWSKAICFLQKLKCGATNLAKSMKT